MKLSALIKGDIRFQFKYGFYFLYMIMTVLYLVLINVLPQTWRAQGAALMIFSDPAAMGLYFMGAIVLFEKGERVLDSIAVSPIRPVEYVLSKLISIAAISVAAGVAIGIGGAISANPFFFVIGVFLGSCLFSAVGLIVAVKISTLNQFVVATIPAELLINVPAIAWFFGWKPDWLLLHPGVCILELCTGGNNAAEGTIILLLWTAALTLLTVKFVADSMKCLGGVKL